MPYSLFDDLKRKGWHSSIFTTFSVDPAFYDGNVQYRLRTYGCQNNILLADSGKLTKALEAIPEAFLNAGRSYFVYPIRQNGSFHPKVSLRYGRNKARLIIGSANVTSAGWGRNKEILSAIAWASNNDTSDNESMGRLVKKTHNYLLGLLPTNITETLDYKLRLLEQQSPWLRNLESYQSPEILSDGTSIDIFFGGPHENVSIVNQFTNQVSESLDNLLIISPYWDKQLHALNTLRDKLGRCPISIFINPGLRPEDDHDNSRSTFPVDILNSDDDIRFYHLGNEKENYRFLHSKLIVAQSNKYDYVLYGSANCTTAAMGTINTPGKNSEASIYRKLPRGTIETVLGLSFEQEIKRGEILAPNVDNETSDEKNEHFFAGTMERHRNKIVWDCADGLTSQGAHIEIEHQKYDVTLPAYGHPYVMIVATDILSSLIAKVHLKDGRVSTPVIISSPDELRRAAPSPIGQSLRNKLDGVLHGNNDLIDLARDIHLIFGTEDEEIKRSNLRASSGKRISSGYVAGVDYETAEEFRKAISLSPEMDRESLAHADNPALQIILKIILKGIFNFGDSESLEEEERREAVALKAGDDEDDLGEGEDSESNDEEHQTLADRDQKVYKQTTTDEFLRNKESLLKMMGEYENALSKLYGKDSKLDIEFSTKALFIIFVMLYGSSHTYVLEDGEEHTLLNFSIAAGADREEIFIIRAAKIIKHLWAHDFEKGLIYRVQFDKTAGVLPPPLAILIILSRWILASILLEVRSDPNLATLRGILEKEVPMIFKSTMGFVTFDQADIKDVITGIQENIGIEKLHRQSVIDEVFRLEAEISRGAN